MSLRTRAKQTFSEGGDQNLRGGTCTSVSANGFAAAGRDVTCRRGTLNGEERLSCDPTQENNRFETTTTLYFTHGDRSIGGRRSRGLK